MSEKKAQRRTRRSIRTQLSLTFVLAATIPMVIALIIVIAVQNTATANDLNTNLTDRVTNGTHFISTELLNQLELLQSLADSKSLEQTIRDAEDKYVGTDEQNIAFILEQDAVWQAGGPEADALIQQVVDNPASEALTEFSERFTNHVEVFVTDNYGAIVLATNPISDYYQGDEAWWQGAWDNGNGAIYVAHSSEYGTSADALAINMAVPIRDDTTGQLLGVVRTTYAVRGMAETINGLRFLDTGRVILVDHEGFDLFTRHDAASSQESVFAQELVDTTDSAHAPVISVKLSDGTQVLLKSQLLSTNGQYPVIDNLDWHVVALENQEEVYRAANLAILSTLLGLGVVAVVAGSLGLTLARRLANPLQVLTGAAERLRSGDFRARAQITRQDEFGVLAETFNEMSDQIQSSVSNLERNVAARTHDLATAVEVGQLATSIYEEHELTPRLVEFIQAQFGLYYTQIYLIDEAQRYAILRHGSGSVGKELLARSHKLDLSQTSIVARVVQTGQPVLVANTETSDIHRPNPLLPNTRSEAALPLAVAGEIFGVLDMQAERAGTFNPDNLPVFQAMANQVATALRGAQAFDRVQGAIERAEAINRRLTSDTWSSYLGKAANEGRVGYEYNLEAPQPLTHPIEHQPEKVVEKNRAVQPIILRGQQIGTLVVQDDDDWHEWRPDELTLIEGVASRVAQSLEQFRAFDETHLALEATEVLYRASGQVNRAATMGDILQTLVDLTAIGTYDRANFIMFDRPWHDEMPDIGTVTAVWEKDGHPSRRLVRFIRLRPSPSWLVWIAAHRSPSMTVKCPRWATRTYITCWNACKSEALC
ncbi:MAG: GAF domain-containing protein [Anaerolineaceae bacterium]|nr:GAF domain-containing protein [Anaerolineaceae bacterium]